MKKKSKSPQANEAAAAKSGNVTLEKLSGLPFKTAKELKQAQEEVRLSVWRRLEEAKVLSELIQRDEYHFWRDEFKSGLICGYGEKSDTNLVRVYSTGLGIKIDINRSLAEAAPSSETVLGVLVEAMSRSFAGTYYRAKGILPSAEPTDDQKKTLIP